MFKEFRFKVEDEQIISKAIGILESRLRQPGAYFSNSEDLKKLLALKYAELEYECFSVLFLNSEHGLIDHKEMFRGSVNRSVVHFREILKAAMELNASKLVLSHNHPSGNCQPGKEDIELTLELRALLSLVDVVVLDHIVVGGAKSFSMAEHGILW